jgi:spore germination protein GerM
MIPRHLQIAFVVLLGAVLGLSGYLWYWKRHAPPPRVTESAHVAPPVVGPTETVTLYVAYDDPGMLVARGASIPLPSDRQERAQQVLRALFAAYQESSSPHPIAAGSEIRNVYLVDGVAVIDANTAFADGHRSGILVEELTVLSLVHTLATSVPGISRVKILVDGKERETLAGHADLTGFYDVGNVEQVVNQIKAAQ